MDIKVDTRLSLDDKKAKSQLRELERAKAQTQRGRASASTRKPITGRLGKVAGAVVGFAAVSRILRANSGENVDAWAEAMSPANAAVQQAIDETVGYSAIARKRARLETRERFASSVGSTGSTAAAQAHFRRAHVLTSEEEEGRNILRADPRFSGPNFSQLISEAVPGYFVLLWKSIGYMVDAVTK